MVGSPLPHAHSATRTAAINAAHLIGNSLREDSAAAQPATAEDHRVHPENYMADPELFYECVRK